jgi:VWFA-related protein
MKPTPYPVLPLVAALALSPSLDSWASPQEPPGGQDVPTFAVSAAAVTLDVVVRDKKGNVVRDLKAEDFGIFEDGVIQRVESFEVFGRGLAGPRPGEAVPSAAEALPAEGPRPAAPTAAPAPPDEGTRPQVIAFVFDRLNPEARHTAHKAAMTYVDKGRVEGDIVGVFSIDLALRTMQPFTDDAALIREGLERAAAQANTAYADNRGQTRNVVERVMAGDAQAAAIAGSNPGQGSDANAISSQAAAASLNSTMGSIQASMLRSFEALERDQQGFASTNGLLSVVNGLKSLPGRKTVVFFSEGLAVTSNVQAQFRSVIHSANRANVSVYTMDAAGLRVLSMNDETRQEMMQAQARRISQLESGRDDGRTGPGMRQLERNEDLLRLSAESGLGQLANETGGFMIRDTNDAESAFRRIEEDMRFHYLLGYTPTNEDYDGRFRSIAVKVSRPGLQVQTRQGYYAIRAIESAPLRSFEAPALARLDQRTPPREFPLQVVGLNFPNADKPGLSPVLVRAPGSAVTYAADKQDKSGQKLQRGEFSVVVRVRDAAGREVDRLSQNYPLSAPLQQLDAARGGDILFYREADLAPGRYTLEAVGYDAQSQKASVAKAPLEVRGADPARTRLSSVMLVGRAEKVPAGESAAGNPLFFGDTILYPNMGEPVSRAASSALGFYFTVYGVPAGGRPKAVLEVFRDGQSAGQVGTDLPAADATGRVQYAGSLPMQAFPPGAYRLKVTASSGAGQDSREIAFTVGE